MSLTYFGLLPPEIPFKVIKPELDDLSLALLRCAYCRSKLPLVPSLYADAVRTDNLKLVKFLIDQRVPFCRDKDRSYMYENIAAVKSVEIAAMLVPAFPGIFNVYYRTLYESVDADLKHQFVSNRHLFADFVELVMPIDKYLNYINNAAVNDPIVRVISMKKPEYIVKFGDYFAHAAIVNDDEQWTESLISNGYKFSEHRLRHALSAGKYAVIPILRKQLDLSDNDFEFYCLQANAYELITDSRLLELNSLVIRDPLTNIPLNTDLFSIFVKLADRGAIEMMNKLASHVNLQDQRILQATYQLSIIQWFYDRGIYVNIYDLIQYHADTIPERLFRQIIGHRQLTTDEWIGLINDQRLDFIKILLEAGQRIQDDMEVEIFNEDIFNLLHDHQIGVFMVKKFNKGYFQYLQWLHSRGFIKIVTLLVGDDFKLSERIWLIEHGYRYTNKIWKIDCQYYSMAEVMEFVAWMQYNTYKIADTVVARGFEENYRL